VTPVTEIEIRDPDPAEPGDPTAAASAEAGAESPYRNLLVPLVVVPALIVMVIVLIVALFSMVTGKEDSPRDNLQRVLNGGFNERKQAAFNLVQQMLSYQQELAAGKTPEWTIDATFLPDLRAARDRVQGMESPGDVPVPFLLASLLAQLGEPEGLDDLIEMTHLSDALDPQGEYRWYAVVTLSSLGPLAPEPERGRIVETLIGLVDSPDDVLALTAIAGLQRLPSEATVPALRGTLGSGDLARRGTAALSLATLGEASGAEVLREMLDPAPYEAERAADPRRWPPLQVSNSRCKALEALGTLGLAPEGEALRRLAEEDPDPNVRRQALVLQKGAGS